MTSSARPRRPAPARAPARTPTTPREVLGAAVIHGLLAMVGAVVIATIATLLFWIVASGGSGSAPDAVRSGALVVLAACQGGLSVSGSTVTLLPLGLTALVALPCWRAGAALGSSIPPHPSLGRRIGLPLAAAAAFAVAALVLSMAIRVGSVQARPLPTALGAFALFAAAAAVPYARATGRVRHPLEGPLVSVIILRAAAAGLAVLVGCAAAVAGAALALSAGTARTLSEQVGGGGFGGLPLAVLGALFVPNAVVAALSYLAGPGFAIGAGSTVTAAGPAVGAVPAFPLLAALPNDHGANPAVIAIMVAAPLVAGATIVRLLWVQLPYRRPAALLLGTVLAVLAVAAAVAALAALSGGGLGPGRLSDLGPPALLAGAAVGAEVGAAAVGALVALGVRALLQRRTGAEVVVTSGQPSSPVEADADDPDGLVDLVADDSAEPESDDERPDERRAG